MQIIDVMLNCVNKNSIKRTNVGIKHINIGIKRNFQITNL